MGMFCFQCQEAAGGVGCKVQGVCGKTSNVAVLQDLLIYNLKGISLCQIELKKINKGNKDADVFVMEGLFMTITNANFDKNIFELKIQEAIELKKKLIKELELNNLIVPNHESVKWEKSKAEFETFGQTIGVLSSLNEDIRSLREMLIYGIKGMAAYNHHAFQLGFENQEVHDFMQKGLKATLDDTLTADDLVALVLECGKFGVEVMALLDKANTSTYGNPEITKVNIGVRNNPAILISGHDLRDMKDLLEQTKGTGVDVYTHSEMLAANYYPEFKKYEHFVGNYGNAWWKQSEEFEKFNGAILMTTNCITPVKDSYKDRIFTTGAVGYEGVEHIPDRVENKAKDFSKVIEKAKSCPSPTEIETGSIVGGFAHNQVLSLADKVVEAVKSGAIKRFFVMAGCDARMKSRDYYSEFAKKLPKDTIILTAGCAKYRYNKLDLGDIGGIPRVLDAGQCNDSYSLAVIALKLKEVFNLEDINDLPISYNIAWYEQKAVIVLLALLYLGVKNIHLGPTLPAFLSKNVANVLVEKFGIAGITNVEEDLKIFLG